MTTRVDCVSNTFAGLTGPTLLRLLQYFHRLEFMLLGQSAGTVASMAIDSNSDVQDLPYSKIREQLLKDGQILEMPEK